MSDLSEEEKERRKEELKWLGLSDQVVEDIIKFGALTREYPPVPKELFDKTLKKCVERAIQKRQEKTKEESKLSLWRRWWNKFLSLFR